MRRLVAATAVVVSAAPAGAAVRGRSHVPGCGSRACDDRVGARWARVHPVARVLRGLVRREENVEARGALVDALARLALVDDNINAVARMSRAGEERAA